MTLTTTPLTPYSQPSSLQSSGGLLSDVIDIINPLQHIPFVSQVYRAATGDSISTGATIVGGGLFGGITGAAISAVSTAVEGLAGGQDAIIHKAQAMLGATSQVASPAIATGEPVAKLNPDNGEALVSMIIDGTFDEDPRLAVVTPSAAPVQTAPHLRDFREARPLGLSADAIAPQLNAQLAAQANKILS